MKTFFFSVIKKWKRSEDFLLRNFRVGFRKIGLGEIIDSSFYRFLARQRNLLHQLLYEKSKPKGIILLSDIQGSKMYVDSRDTHIAKELLTNGFLERYETELFKKLIKKGMVVVDVGANIGYYSLIGSKLVGENGIIYAFEPESSNYAILCRNIGENGYRNIVSIKKGVSNRCCREKLWKEKTDSATPSFSRDNVTVFSQKALPIEDSFEEVETTTLDDFFAKEIKKGRVDFIKMDVQGAEGLIVEGAKKLLKRNKLTILMEFWPQGLKRFGTDPLALLLTLKRYGFAMYSIEKDEEMLQSIDDIGAFFRDVEGKTYEYNLLLEN